MTPSYLPLLSSDPADSADAGRSPLPALPDEGTAAGEPSPLFRLQSRAAAEAATTRLRILVAQLALFSAGLGFLGYQAGIRVEPGPSQAVASTAIPTGATASGRPGSTRTIASPPTESTLLSTLHRDSYRIATAPILPSSDDRQTFLGMSTARLQKRMQSGEIRSIKKNRGGSSISLRVEFADGSRAAFKPVQSNPQTVPRKEAAAFELSRLLGLNLVAPVVMRSLPHDELFAKLDPASYPARARIERETHFDENGQTLGAFAYWIPRVANPRLDTTAGILRWTDWLGQAGTVPQDKTLLLSQLSSLLVFDLLQNNSDRFSGGNLLGAPDGKTLYFMDNAFGFQTDPEGHTRCWFYLNRVQKFSRRLVQALEKLQANDLRAAMVWQGPDGTKQPLLSDEEQAAVLQRRDRALAYINGLIEVHGRDRVLVFD